MNAPLTEHFTWDEVTRSDTASRYNIDNSLPPHLEPFVRYTAQHMEEVRTLLGHPIHINSWYRGGALERQINDAVYRKWCAGRGLEVNDDSWITYFTRKSHPKGQAVDFTCAAYGPPQRVFDAIKKSGMKYDQLIIEFDAWVHVSFAEAGSRMQALIIDNNGTRYA